jgi:RNA polymerase sigma-70 factor (ECF subfamily)
VTEERDDDAVWVEQARSGSRSAFDQIVVRHRDHVERLVVRYVKDPEEARDVAQSVFLRVFENLHHFHGVSSFRTWLHRVPINVALNHRASAQAPTPWLELEDDMAFTRSLGTTRVVAAELSRKVHERLTELPPKQRLVAELRLFQDLPFAEIAAIAGCSENSAKVNFQHAIKRLRELAPSDP